MKKIIVALSILLVVSCVNEPKNYVSLSGTITNQNSDSVVIRTSTYSKTIAVAKDGTFSDTLKIAAGIFNFYDGNESASIFLKNGIELNITLDTEQFDETISYKGSGAASNNFLASYSLLKEELLDQDFIEMDKKTFDKTFIDIENKLTNLISENKNIDSIVSSAKLNEINPLLGSYKNYFGGIVTLKSELNGKPSPTFDNYQNYDGSKTSLSDLKGKYVYVDVWATWCGPCKREIPFLKEVEEKYHGKNIAFVSLSVDDDRRSGSWEKAEQDWKKMIADKNLGGIQILAPKGWSSEFVQGYKIQGIPRFILIGPEGTIIDASAPRPSDEKLIKLFESHNI